MKLTQFRPKFEREYEWNNVKDKEIEKNTKINEKIKRKKVYVLLEHVTRYLRKKKEKEERNKEFQKNQ